MVRLPILRLELIQLIRWSGGDLYVLGFLKVAICVCGFLILVIHKIGFPFYSILFYEFIIKSPVMVAPHRHFAHDDA